MKRGLTIGLAIAALGITVSLVTADSAHEPVTAADAVPAYQVMTTLREMGLEPNRDPVRRGPYYVLHAMDRRGVEMRVVADAHFGDIISVTPARPSYAVNYYRGPRIIRVPQPGDEDADARAIDGDDNIGDLEEAAPEPLPRAKPKPQRRSAVTPEPKRRPYSASPPPAQRRAVLSAPPPPAKSPGPIYPTPRFENAEKFGPPAENAPPPPPGYEPPGMPPAEN